VIRSEGCSGHQKGKGKSCKVRLYTT
jgi:hypothetical protein